MSQDSHLAQTTPGPGKAKRPRVGVFWQCYGPYHWARFDAFREAAAETYEILAVEVSEISSTYAWRREGREGAQIKILAPGRVAETCGALTVFMAMRRWLEQAGVSVLFVPSYWPGYALGAALAARKAGNISVVVMTDSHHASGVNTQLMLAVKSRLLRVADAAFVAGSIHRAFMRRLGMPADRIFDGYDIVDNAYFGHAADAARAKADEWKRRLRLPEKYVLSLGRLVSKKNVETILAAYVRMVATGTHQGHHLVIVGSGPEQDRLVALARSAKLSVKFGEQDEAPPVESAAVHFHPFAQADITPVYYALARVFVLASRTDEWGLVVNEAMACGLPVVVSRRVGAAPDLVRPGENGYQFYPDNPEELALCLQRICARDDLAAKMAKQARVDIADWSVDRFTRGALAATTAALRPWDHRLEQAGAVDETLRDVRVLQTCLPDYRVAVFGEAARRLPKEFRLFSGPDYFTPDVRVTEDCHDWRSPLHNRFLLNRKSLWQEGAIKTMLSADVVVMELNPRILSNWVILALRSAFGAPSVLWGHTWARQGVESPVNILRLLMMRMASGVLTYTHTQRRQLQKMLAGKAIFTATNSLVSARDCMPASERVSDLCRVIYVGRLNPSKKVKLLVEGFARACKKLPPEVELCVVGEGSERAGLAALAQELGIENRVRLPGHISNSAILRDLYGGAFCSVSPGYVGLSCIQSFSFGVPLLVADKEPHAPEIEACESGRNSVFFHADDPDDLARKLISLWADRETWFEKRHEMSEDIAKHYSVESMVGGLIAAVDAVCPPCRP
ncbi:MAG: glycosyltransferase family 4 protein [Burkholderiales bacterium]|nr:glycosyltransferase family 4 protein [Opitutaceae bacterium]